MSCASSLDEDLNNSEHWAGDFLVKGNLQRGWIWQKGRRRSRSYKEEVKGEFARKLACAQSDDSHALVSQLSQLTDGRASDHLWQNADAAIPWTRPVSPF